MKRSDRLSIIARIEEMLAENASPTEIADDLRLGEKWPNVRTQQIQGFILANNLGRRVPSLRHFSFEDQQ